MNYSSKLPGAKAAAALVIVMMAVIPLRAQIDRGAIVGTVRDSSGAVIPNASVTVTNRDTGVSVSTRTNSAGAYQVLALIPGTYSAAAGAAGFSKQTQSDIVVQVQSRLAVNFTLNVGAVRQEVVVTTPPELLQTETAAVGHVLNSRQIVDLPLNGRRYADLALLEPGVQKYYAAANPAPDRFSSNGNLELQNDFLLNGIDNNSNSENLQEFSVQVVQPPPDALQEFKVQTRTYSAEFGASAGAVVNATLKSGTNQFHGDLWEFVRNNIFDANTFFNNKNGVPVGRFTQNQYGGTIGGPIIKDKTFFFFDYQKLSDRQSETIDSTVPTPMMKQGNFTELPFNLTPSAVAGQSGCLSGNVISGAGCIDSVGSKLLAVFPDPNIPSAVAVEGTPGSWSGGNNYQFATTVPDDTWSLDGRLDQQINEKNHLFGSYSYYHVLREDPPWTSNPLAGNGNFATSYHIRDQQVALSLNTTLSNSLLNELRVGFNREYAHSDPVGVALGSSAASQFGLNGIPVGPNTAGLPPININGLVRLGTSPWRPQWQIAQSWELLESITKLSGKHSIVAGYQYLHKSDNFLDIESPQGQITANGIYTAGGSFGVPDFLLGDIDSISFTTPLVVHDYNVGHSFYAQDTWQAKRNLTLNYGLRYELFSPVLNHQNELTNFSPANGGSLVTAASGSWYQRSLIHPDYNNFAPRVGFAYHPLSRVVVRGGYGVFYQPTNRIGSEAMEALNPPWLLNANLGQGIGSTTPVMFLNTGFPSGDFTPALVTLPGLQIRAQDPNQRTSYVEQASFGPEIQLSNNMMLAINYVGNWGRKMNRLRNANQGVVTGFNSAGTPIIAYPYANLNTVSIAPSGVGTQAFLELATNDGNTDYNALQFSLRRTFTHGFGFNINYTWSHNLANFVDNLTGGAFPQNAYNYGNEMSNSPFDVQNRFVSDLIWQLPFGQGRAYLAHLSRAADLALGGWQFNTIVTAQTGSPFDIAGPDTTGTAPSGGQDSYANCIGNPFAGASTDPSKYVIGGGGFFINPAAFAIPAAGQFGTCAPRAFHGPGLWDVDLSLFKEFRITESKRFEFRAEFFNAFNHPNFANPSNYIGSPGSFGKVFGTLSPILGANSGGPGDPREVQLALKFYF